MVACRSRRCRGVTGPRAGGVHYRRLVFEVLEQRGMLSGVSPLDPLGGDLGLVDPPGASSEPVPALLGSARYSDSLTDPPPIINRQVTDDPGVQQMPSIAVDPLDSQHLVLAYMDYSLPTADSGLAGEGYAGIGVAVSHDAGDTWQRTAIALPGSFDQGAANPIVRFDDQGQVFVSFMAATFPGQNRPALTNPDVFNPERNASDREYGFQSNNGIFVARSDDGGLTWQPPAAVSSRLYDGQHDVFFEIVPDIAIDTFPSLPDGRPNPNYGNVYVVWSRVYPVGQFPGHPEINGGIDVMIAASADGGRTWQTRLRDVDGIAMTVIQDPENTAGLPGLGVVDQARIAVGREGEVYVSNYGGGDFTVHVSTDGGKSFAVPDHGTGTRIAMGTGFATITNITPLPNNQFRKNVVRAVAADPARPGHVYAAENVEVLDALGNSIDAADIFFARSEDQGEQWRQDLVVGGKTAIVLNDDNDGQRAPVAGGDSVIAGQVMPRLAVDDQGNIAAVWYDTRRDPADHLLDVFGAVSTDGGQTFSPNFRITDTSFDAGRGAFTDAAGQADYYLGDFLGLAMANNTAYAAWADTRNGNQDIYFARYPIHPAPQPLGDRFEPNAGPVAGPTMLGRVVKRVIPKLSLPAGDEDWFAFEAAATGQLTVSAYQSGPGDTLRLELWDEQGTTVLATGVNLLDESAVRGERILLQTAARQPFLLKVLPNENGETRYSLEIQSLTADVGTQVHGMRTGSLASGDEAFFLWAAAAAGSLEIQVTSGASAQGSMNLNLLDANDLSILATGQLFGSPGAGSIQRVSLPVTKDQAVLMHVFGDAGWTGDFGLEFTNLDQWVTQENARLLFPAGGGPSQAALGDLDGDGHLDLAVSNTLSDTLSGLSGHGDGTFRTPRQCIVGAFRTPLGDITRLLPSFGRGVTISEFNGDSIRDIVVTNSASDDVSVLLGLGDGTFAVQRRFDAVPQPVAVDAADLNGDGITDLAVVSASTPRQTFALAILLGRGDGTFQPPRVMEVPSGGVYNAGTVRIAEFNEDGKPDLVVSGSNTPFVSVLLGNGDGTFTLGGRYGAGRLGVGLAVADINEDGRADIVNTGFDDRNQVALLLGNGDGTFQTPQNFFAGQNPVAVEIADLGSEVKQPDGSTALGPPDGHPDAVVALSGVTVSSVNVGGPPQVVVLPGRFGADGLFVGLGSPRQLALAAAPQDVDVGDVNGDGALDVAVVDRDGVLVIFGKPPVIPPNNTPQTARDLGTLVHLVEPMLTIVPGHEDAYYKLTVPTEAVVSAGDEILDFSALFEHTEGAGLSMDLLDAQGDRLASGPRFRVQARQGEELLLHVFGVESPSGATGQTPGLRGAGAYTLVIDVLPQVVSVEAQALLPGQGERPGGPTTSLVITFQGDRLDTATAEDAGNYTLTYLGPDGQAGTADDRTIPVSSLVHNPGANVDVSSGLTYPTAVRQTVTLVFDQPLPAGSYGVELSPGIQTAPFNEAESDLLADPTHFAGHPVVSDVAGRIAEGVRVQAVDLVMESGSLGDLDVFYHGTPFLTQLQNDLGARLDSLLTAMGDAPGVSDSVLREILDRVAPGLGEPGKRPTSMLVIFLDPMAFSVADANNRRVAYDLQANTPVNQVPATFVEVGGNVEVVTVANAAGSYRVNLADVPQNARGGAVLFGAAGDEVLSLTSAIREGQRSFVLSMDTAQPSPSSLSGPAAAAAALLASPVQAVTNLVVAPTQPAPSAPTDNSGAAQQSGGTASVPSSSGSYLGGSPGGGVGLVAEGTDGGDGAPGDAAGKDGGNPPNKPNGPDPPPSSPVPPTPALLNLLRQLWELLTSILPLPHLNRP